MPASSPSLAGPSDSGPIVALLLPSLVDGAALDEGLRKTLGTAPGAVRLLVCIPEGPAEPLLSMLAGLKADMQILVGQQVHIPQTGEFVVRAPVGMSEKDLHVFALALCDVVLVRNGNESKQFARHASLELGKELITIGSDLHLSSRAVEDATEDLDPDKYPWRRWIYGRLEQGMMECLALLGCGDGKKRKSRLLRSFRWKWGPIPYFAPQGPEGWEALCPDRAAVDDSSALVRCFAAMDRSASFGSFKHRDIAWLAHFGVAFAVFFAVVGYIYGYSVPGVPAAGGEASGWLGEAFSWVELVLLVLVVYWIWRARHTNLQDGWTACRFGAEQLRIARMSLPLLVLPPALATADAEDSDSGDGEPGRFEFVALNQVKRAVRRHGLPRVDYGSITVVDAARWLRLIVADQMRYHHDNHQTLHRAEEGLRRVSGFFFALSIAAVAAVLLKLHGHDPRFLMATAAGPAFAAALHGAGMRLGIVHRAALSRDMEKQLKKIVDALEMRIKAAASSPRAWQEVRDLAYKAAEAMGEENSSWHHLVRRYRDELP